VLLALAANPSFAKDSHAHHGARANTTNTATTGKGTSGAKPALGKANASIESGETIAPPVLPPRGVTQQVRIVNPSAKNAVNAPHSQTAVITGVAPAVHNPIGQPIVAPKNFVGAQPSASPALRASGVVSPPIVSPGSAHVNVAKAPNRGSVNGATVIRPANALSAIGGPAQPRYGINGTMVQNRH
jgi:hypothetical protein